MRIGTLFSGIGSPEQAAKRVYGDKFSLIFACEWDKFARESFKANYTIDDKDFHKDITDMDGTQYQGKVDCIIGGSPCQSFSLAGLRKGLDDNRGILIYEYIRIIKEVEPPIFIYENGLAPTLNAKGGGMTEPKIKVPSGTKIGYELAGPGDTINLKNLKSSTRRGTVGKQLAHTLDTSCNQAIVESKINENYRIRKLTPRECFRLQDFPDDFKFVVSNSQLYKQAGNAMSVNVVEMILKRIEATRNGSLELNIFNIGVA